MLAKAVGRRRREVFSMRLREVAGRLDCNQGGGKKKKGSLQYATTGSRGKA
jgi:hypothetical protein